LKEKIETILSHSWMFIKTARKGNTRTKGHSKEAENGTEEEKKKLFCKMECVGFERETRFS